MSEDIVKKLRVPPDLMTDFGRVGVIGEAADEIERLRARVEVLEKVREAADAWRADMALPVDHIRTGRIGCHLIAALDEAKA
jgi:hypothetical protein